MRRSGRGGGRARRGLPGRRGSVCGAEEDEKRHQEGIKGKRRGWSEGIRVGGAGRGRGRRAESAECGKRQGRGDGGKASD